MAINIIIIPPSAQLTEIIIFTSMRGFFLQIITSVSEILLKSIS